MIDTGFYLQIKGVSKIFPNNFVALNKVSLEVKQGEVIVLIGPSGSGKSTLLRLINQFDDFDEGNIFINNQSYRDSALNVNALRARVGMVFQSLNLFPHLNVLNNITLAPRTLKKLSPKVAEDRARELLDHVGILDQAHKYPINLSGGQQQRVAIVRALIMEPELILFDEPTSALDPELVADILATIETLAAKNVTMMIATHEMKFAQRIADKVLFLADGHILEEGSAKWIFEDCPNSRVRGFLNKF